MTTEDARSNKSLQDAMDSRFYKYHYPQINDFVMTQIISIKPEGSDLTLPEYNYLSGYVTSYELATKVGKKYKINAKVNDLIPMRVINIDTNNNFVITSRKNITEEEIRIFKEKYKYAANNNKICDEINALYTNYIKTNLTSSHDFARQILWNMYENFSDEDDDTDQQNIFKIVHNQILTNPTTLLMNYDQEFKDKMVNNFKKRIIHKEYSLETELTLITCQSMQNLKNVLNKVNILDENEIRYITTVNSPKYKIIVEGTNIDKLSEFVTIMLDDMKEASKENNVHMSITYINKQIKDYSNENMIQLKFLSSHELTSLLA